MDSINRRSALAALSTAGALAAVPVAAIARNSSADRAAWDRAFAKMEKAKAASAAEDARHEPIWQAYKAAIDAVPHVSLKPDPYSGREAPFTTEDWRFISFARQRVQDVAAGKCRLETENYPSLRDHFERCKEAVVAADARAAEIARIDQRLGYTASAAKCEQACSDMVDAECALHEVPAPDGPALLWKLENTWLGDEEASYSHERVSMILADARRLLADGRA